jgi:deoxycytidine triphosphate deaminase
VSVLSDYEIKRAIVEGHIVCRPLRSENIKPSSIDLTLGEFFWRCDAKPHGVFNPYDRAEVDRYFSGPFTAKPYASVYKKLGGRHDARDWPTPAIHDPFLRTSLDTPHPFNGIPEDWPVIVLRPRERLLAHSHEYVGIRAPGSTMLKARSSTGRVGLKVCDDAGWGDPGFINRWTWEMRNDNDEAIIIPVGERMAQIVFFHTGEVEGDYGAGAAYDGKYQTRGKSVDQLINDWSPYDMLPRNWKDERQPLGSLDEEAYAQAVNNLAEKHVSRR